MQHLAHQGAALSVAIIPDCLCSLPTHQQHPPSPALIPHPRPPLCPFLWEKTYSPVCPHQQTPNRHAASPLMQRSTYVHVNTDFRTLGFKRYCLQMRLVHFFSCPPLLTLSCHLLTPSSGKYQQTKQITLFFNHTLHVCLWKSVCVCLCRCLCGCSAHCCAAHSVQCSQCALGLSRILFILLLILK